MKTFSCANCGYVVFFENFACGNCGAALGFVPEELDMVAFGPDVGGDGSWPRLGGTGSRNWRPCHNYAVEAVCNWMVRVDDDPRCSCCRHTEDTSAVRNPANKDAWFKLESAKRRVFYALYQLGLPLGGSASDGGPSFRFLERTSADTDVITGHEHGVITLSIAEADDAEREARRLALHEPYRTLLGHFRHEIGHYYWDRLIAHTRWLAPFRALFGDERADYAAALAAHYHSAPPPDWPERHISAYATMHPWEDWAETWAHYLHIADALDTAAHWGLSLHSDQSEGGPADLPVVDSINQPFRRILIEQWLPLSQFLNSMGRSLGQGDAYPFVIAPAVVDKLCFIHDVIVDARVRSSPAARLPDSSGEVVS